MDSGRERMKRTKERLIVVSNRLPFVFERTADGEWKTERGAGGLVTALVPVLRDRGGTWIGWPGTSENGPGLADALQAASKQLGIALRGVQLDAADVDNFYHGFSNEIIWPLFHDLQGPVPLRSQILAQLQGSEPPLRGSRRRRSAARRTSCGCTTTTS